MAGEAAVEAEGLRKSYGEVAALRGVDLLVEAATVFGLLGPNGAGKTTAVRILTTLLRAEGGTARVAGFDVVRDAAELRARIGAVPRGRAPPSCCRSSTSPKPADGLVRTYSGGMRRRLDLAAALVARPPVLFLDEPTTGLDPRSRIGLREAIEALVAEGTTVLLTTQYLDEADRLPDRIAVIDHGLVIAQGTPGRAQGTGRR